MEKKLKSYEYSDRNNVILFMDVIIYPTTLEKTLENLRKLCPLNFNMKFVAIMP